MALTLEEEAMELIEELMFGFPEDDAEILDRAEELLQRMRERSYGKEEKATDASVEAMEEGVDS